MAGALEAACGDVLSTLSFSYLSAFCIKLGHSRSFSTNATTMHHVQDHHTEQTRKRIVSAEHSIFN